MKQEVDNEEPVLVELNCGKYTQKNYVEDVIKLFDKCI